MKKYGKEKTGTVKVLDITSDKFLQPVLKELGGYQIAPLKSCSVGYIAEIFRQVYPTKYSSKVLFFHYQVLPPKLVLGWSL
jgi:hypothetical protein